MLPDSAITASGLDCKSACRSGVCNDRIPALLVSRAILPLMLTSCQAKIWGEELGCKNLSRSTVRSDESVFAEDARGALAAFRAVGQLITKKVSYHSYHVGARQITRARQLDPRLTHLLPPDHLGQHRVANLAFTPRPSQSVSASGQCRKGREEASADYLSKSIV